MDDEMKRALMRVLAVLKLLWGGLKATNKRVSELETGLKNGGSQRDIRVVFGPSIVGPSQLGGHQRDKDGANLN